MKTKLFVCMFASGSEVKRKFFSKDMKHNFEVVRSELKTIIMCCFEETSVLANYLYYFYSNSGLGPKRPQPVHEQI